VSDVAQAAFSDTNEVAEEVAEFADYATISLINPD
jgi:hypothetical protein